VLVQTNSQIEATFVGNSDLRAEKADTFTAGIQLVPTFAPGLTLSVDYFDIKVDGYISRVRGGSAGLVAACFGQNITTAAQLAADLFCNLLSRRPNGELLANVPLTNEASIGVNNVLKTRGVDFVMGYETRLGSGDSKISLSSNVTYLMDYKFNGTDFSGFSSADFGALAHWKVNTRLTYSDDSFNISLNWQYIGKVTETFGGSTTEPDLPNIKS
jgi:iron complex outermembrane recepter protein